MELKLIYFSGCPEAKNARAALLNAGAEKFDVVVQDKLSDDDPYRLYSSPSILKGDEILYGQKIKKNSSACSYQKLNSEKLRKKITEGADGGKKGVMLGAFASAGSGAMALFCPMCFPAVGAFLASAGLGFAVQGHVLRLVLVFTLVLANLGFLWSYLKKHHNIWPFIFGSMASFAMYIGRYVYLSPQENKILLYSGIPALIGVSLWNLYLSNRVKRRTGCCG
ncbi:MAG: hypothetical protein CME64_09090 [Halobacteriovoraceae bacterium]|nr:hypothetical protein [Halobacteriovoraceae bacterium]|tara:strand:- start:11378 stop:12046 length:669 start_codon:yes stop_codon:yes gene_type:complete